MIQIQRWVLFFCVAAISMVNYGVAINTVPDIAHSFTSRGIVPDVLNKAPPALVTVNYRNGIAVNRGNELTPTDVKDAPSVSWDAYPDQFYTLALIDPDAPSRDNPVHRDWLHWLVGNIPGNNSTNGLPLAAYIGSGPPKGSGLHRYVFLVYRQPGRLRFSERRLINTSGDHRRGFSIVKFAAKYGLGDPVAGNFYQAQYDDYVPLLYKKLSKKVYLA